MQIFRSSYATFFRNAEGVGSGGGGGVTPPANNDGDRITVDRQYIKDLRDEASGYRLKLKETEGQKKALEDQIASIGTEHSEKLTAAEKSANERVIRAELKAIALKSGLVDLDGLKLADLSKVTLKDDGTLDGAEAALEALKTSKPYLFGSTNTSSTHTPPGKTDNTPKKATEMTDAEWAEAKKQYGI